MKELGSLDQHAPVFDNYQEPRAQFLAFSFDQFSYLVILGDFKIR